MSCRRRRVWRWPRCCDCCRPSPSSMWLRQGSSSGPRRSMSSWPRPSSPRGWASRCWTWPGPASTAWPWNRPICWELLVVNQACVTTARSLTQLLSSTGRASPTGIAESSQENLDKYLTRLTSWIQDPWGGGYSVPRTLTSTKSGSTPLRFSQMYHDKVILMLFLICPLGTLLYDWNKAL